MVTDDIIKNHINTLSQGKLKIPEKIFDTTNVNIIKSSYESQKSKKYYNKNKKRR